MYFFLVHGLTGVKKDFFHSCTLDQIPKESAKVKVKKVMATTCPVFEEKVDCNRNDEAQGVPMGQLSCFKT